MQDLNAITRLNIAEDLFKRLPPSQSKETAEVISSFTPEVKKGFHLKIDAPSDLILDEAVNKMFFKCDYNRDGNSYRSPYTNQYYPAIPQAMMPSLKIREIEEKANSLFEDYVLMYYEHGLMNVFFSERQDGISGCLLIRKEVENVNEIKKGVWNSITYIDIKDDPSSKREKKAKVTTSIYLDVTIENEKLGCTELSGSVKKNVIISCLLNLKKDKVLILDETSDETLLINIGKLIEEVELSAQTALEDIYFIKTKEIVQKSRKVEGGLKTKEIGNKLFHDMHPLNQQKIKFITCNPMVRD